MQAPAHKGWLLLHENKSGLFANFAGRSSSQKAKVWVSLSKTILRIKDSNQKDAREIASCSVDCCVVSQEFDGMGTFTLETVQQLRRQDNAHIFEFSAGDDDIAEQWVDALVEASVWKQVRRKVRKVVAASQKSAAQGIHSMTTKGESSTVPEPQSTTAGYSSTGDRPRLEEPALQTQVPASYGQDIDSSAQPAGIDINLLHESVDRKEEHEESSSEINYVAVQEKPTHNKNEDHSADNETDVSWEVGSEDSDQPSCSQQTAEATNEVIPASPVSEFPVPPSQGSAIRRAAGGTTDRGSQDVIGSESGGMDSSEGSDSLGSFHASDVILSDGYSLTASSDSASVADTEGEDSHRVNDILSRGNERSKSVWQYFNKHRRVVFGDVWSWGGGFNYCLGHGGINDSSFPTQIKKLKRVGVSSVSCGVDHCACVCGSGKVLTWGIGSHGRLGHGGETDVHVPKTLAFSKGGGFLHVSCGAGHTLALSASGVVWAWGGNLHGQCGIGTRDDVWKPEVVSPFDGTGDSVCARSITCGWEHSIIVAEAGSVFTFGRGKYGALGSGVVDDCLQPKLISDSSRLLSKSVIIGASAGYGFSVVLSVKGRVYSWGRGKHGCIGIGMTVDCATPQQVKFPSSRSPAPAIVSAACGRHHVVCCSDDGKVFTWGAGFGFALGQMDDGDRTSPVRVKNGLAKQRALFASAGGYRSAVLCDGGRLFMFGGEGTCGGVDESLVDGSSYRLVQWVPNTVPIFSRPPKALKRESDSEGEACDLTVSTEIGQRDERRLTARDFGADKRNPKVPMRGPWWGRPRLVKSLLGRAIHVSVGDGFTIALANSREAAHGAVAATSRELSGLSFQASRVQFKRWFQEQQRQAAAQFESFEGQSRQHAGGSTSASSRAPRETMQMQNLLSPFTSIEEGVNLKEGFVNIWQEKEGIRLPKRFQNLHSTKQRREWRRVFAVVRPGMLALYNDEWEENAFLKIVLDGFVVHGQAANRVGLPRSVPCIQLESTGAAMANTLNNISLFLTFDGNDRQACATWQHALDSACVALMSQRALHNQILQSVDAGSRSQRSMSRRARNDRSILGLIDEVEQDGARSISGSMRSGTGSSDDQQSLHSAESGRGSHDISSSRTAGGVTEHDFTRSVAVLSAEVEWLTTRLNETKKLLEQALTSKRRDHS